MDKAISKEISDRNMRSVAPRGSRSIDRYNSYISVVGPVVFSKSYLFRGRRTTWKLYRVAEYARRTIQGSNVSVPNQLGIAALGALVVFSAVALYIYYPAPSEAFALIVRVRAEAT